LTDIHIGISTAILVEDEVPEGKIGIGPKEVWKPDISSLPDAIINGKLIVPPGKQIVIQYPEVWRETTIMQIVKVFDETVPTEVVEYQAFEGNEIVKKTRVCIKGTTCDVGYVSMWDMQKGQFAATDYLTAPGLGLVFKVWSGKLPPQ